MDLRYGAFIGGVRKTRLAEFGAHDTANSDYDVLPHIFRDRVRASDMLVDVGCGKGRVLNWWLDEYPTNRIVGIELDSQIAASTRQRLRRFENVAVITGDALDILPPKGTIFYLFNPFDEDVMRKFSRRLLDGAVERRDYVVLYYNPVHVDAFASVDWSIDFDELAKVQGAHRLAVIRPKAQSR
jgi:SAM-dependent methyltransferase